ncbi:MAG TPA: site-2 protease family protein [Candidatus Nanoarchaeia archaeon]|nr:site-2 protease family protein [Candidatus Nanoarchaeia archaeon]
MKSKTHKKPGANNFSNMSFLSFLIEYKWTILFYLIVCLVVYLNRKKFEIQAKIVALHRTKIGINFISRFVKGKEELIKILGLCGIGLGYIGMLTIFYFLFQLLYEALQKPTVFTASPVLPGVPIPGLGINFPLVIGWISLLIIMVIHEFSHGIVAKAHNQSINSTGIAFFGPLLGAFVDIDEKKLRKQPDHVQYSILAAGANANIITSIIFLLLLGFVISPAISSMEMPAGVRIQVYEDLPAKLSGLENNDVIVGVDNTAIISTQDFVNIGVKPYQTYTLHTSDGRSIDVTAREHPNNSSVGQFGIDLSQETRLKNASAANKAWHAVLKWINELLFWLYLIGFSIGLFNFLPIFITDGARMLQISLNKMIKNQARAKKVWLFINKLSLLVLLLLFAIPIVTNIVKFISG